VQELLSGLLGEGRLWLESPLNDDPRKLADRKYHEDEPDKGEEQTLKRLLAQAGKLDVSTTGKD
jgi:hypothetical protein